MGKFKDILTTTGDALLQKRADNLTSATKETFEDEKRGVEKKIRNLENEIINMEDLSIRTTQDLVVGENLEANKWVTKRIDLALELRDLRIELDVIEKLIAEYFSE